MRRQLDVNSTKPSMADGTTLQSGGFSGRGVNFDITMVSILAALLCLLTFALAINFILRNVFRHRRRQATESPEEAASRLAGSGIKKQALHRIPVAVYGPEANIPATECPICIGEFADGDKIRVLPTCHHGFHVRCIDTWLAQHSSCPICRQSLLDGGPGDTEDTHVVSVDG